MLDQSPKSTFGAKKGGAGDFERKAKIFFATIPRVGPQPPSLPRSHPQLNFV